MNTVDLFLSCFRPYRRFRGGTWRYVFHKYMAGLPSCWIRNEEKFWFEALEKEEIYG